MEVAIVLDITPTTIYYILRYYGRRATGDGDGDDGTGTEEDEAEAEVVSGRY